MQTANHSSLSQAAFIFLLVVILFTSTDAYPGLSKESLAFASFQTRTYRPTTPCALEDMSSMSSSSPSTEEQRPATMSCNTSLKPDLKRSRCSTPPSTQSKGPIYITVGPQCCGKTTILKRLFGTVFHNNEEEGASTGGLDITIDDQELVYFPVPIQLFLPDAALPSEQRSTSNQSILGKSVRDRVVDPSNNELKLVIQRLAGKLTAGDFIERLNNPQKNGQQQQSAPLQKNQKAVVADLVSAVEEVIKINTDPKGETTENSMFFAATKLTLPKQIDLFVVESIFRPRPLELMRNTKNNTPSSSALDEAQRLIKSISTDSSVHDSAAPLAWGNTNTRPREFLSAMEAATLSGRPVEFIVFGGLDACVTICKHIMSGTETRTTSQDDGESDLLCLPKLSRRVLLMRNIQRFVNTGRYIPSIAIDDAIVRVESMLAEATKKACSQNWTIKSDSELSMKDAKFRLDCELCKLAGYELHPNRTVSLMKKANANNQYDAQRENRSNHHGRGRGNRSNNSGDRGRGGYDQARGNQGRGRGYSYNERGGRYEGRGGRGRGYYEEESQRGGWGRSSQDRHGGRSRY
jgi:hypothetical protein